MENKLKPFIVIDADFKVLSGCFCNKAEAEKEAEKEGFDNIMEVVELDLKEHGVQHVVK